jgi:hypothetical protein
MYSLIKLAVGSKHLPRMLYVSNVDIGGRRDPWRPGESLSHTLRWRLDTGTYGSAGGFADIYRATLNGKAVVLKRLRVQLTEDTLPDVDQVLPPPHIIGRGFTLRHIFSAFDGKLSFGGS